MPEGLKHNPWTSIWFAPRRTIREVIDFNPRFRFVILSWIYGIPLMFQLIQSLSLGSTLPLLTILIASFVLAPLFGMLWITVTSALLLWTGKWIGGTGAFLHVRAAVSWSNVPLIVTILSYVFLIWAFKAHYFSLEFDPAMMEKGASNLFVMVGLTQFVMTIWSFIILLKGLGEAQGFSAWKALLNVVIPLAIVFLLTWVAMIIIGGLINL